VVAILENVLVRSASLVSAVVAVRAACCVGSRFTGALQASVCQSKTV